MFPQTLPGIDASRKLFRKKFCESGKKFHPPGPGGWSSPRTLSAPVHITNHWFTTPSHSSNDGVPDGVGSARPDGAEFYHIVRVKISQLEPILGDVGGREQVVLLILTLQGGQQILARQMRLLLGLDRPFDGQTFRPLNHRRDDGAAGQIAAIQDVPFTAAINDFEELVFLAF